MLKLTPKATPLLKGEETLVLARPRTKPPKAAKKKRPRAAAVGDLVYDESLYERLRLLRKSFADKQNVPAYVVFGDATLIEMAAKRPRTSDDLLEVNGVGKAKLERYGEAFLEAIATDPGSLGPLVG